jgi:hypothetical protein
LLPLSAAVAGAVAAAERLGLAAALVGVGDAAATVWLGVSERVAVGAAVDVGAGLDVAVGGAVVAVALGPGEAPLKVAQAFVSCVSTVRQTDLALASHAVPSAAVRENATRTNG